MKCEDLKVVNLNITEDYYEYKALFRLCSEVDCMDIDLAKIEEVNMLEQIRDHFGIVDSIDEIKNSIMSKVMEASKLESHISQGENCCKDADDKKVQRAVDSLSTS